ncbi:MgtC/SapB family protein [Paenibacillus sp. TAB 01]|uniref:MgtC/SapB family protein n=1 Tax=Paenibacillus sp. TAB 01 TaxID=3368988 RepID=UPI003750C147
MRVTQAADLWHIARGDVLLRLLLAVVLGGMVGIEREWHHHAAGFRTHILVCLGSAIIMLLSMYGFSDFANEPNTRMDPARLAAQVISGIGFLGAGAILRNGSVISGLTTAASVWVVAAIGLCVGAGFWYAALVATGLALISLLLLNKWEKQWMRHRRHHELTIMTQDYPGVLGKIASAFGDQGIAIDHVRMVSEEPAVPEEDGLPVMKLSLSLKVNSPERLLAAMERIHRYEFVLWVQSEGTPLQPLQPGIGKETQ